MTVIIQESEKMTIKGIIFGAVLAIIPIIILMCDRNEEPTPANDKIDSLLTVGDSLYQYDTDSLRLNLLHSDSLTQKALNLLKDSSKSGEDSIYNGLKLKEL